MSNARQETIADIVAEMRNESHAGDASCLEWVGAKIRGYADRLDVADRRSEAAAKREVAELRKGISELLDALQAIYDEECTSYGTGEVYDKWRKALEGANNEE